MSCDCNQVAAEPKPKDSESHDEYMSRCQEAGYSKEECMKAHEGHKFNDQDKAHENHEVEGYYDDEKKKKKYASEDCGCGCKGAVVAYEEWGEEDVTAAEYQGRKVTLNKPFRTKGGSKKFGVYTKNGSGNVVIVRFGDPNMEIKRDDPARRKAFRSRHSCDSPGPKWKARYWSCRQWRGGKKVEAEQGCGCNDKNAEAKDKDDPCTEGYEQYGMKMKNGRKVPNCIPIGQKAEAEYKVCSSCTTQEKCAKASSCDAEAAYDSCPPGKEMVDGKCKVISVTLDLDINEVEAKLIAETGKTVYEIRGIALHEGMNKNSWSLTPQGAKAVAEQMKNSDVTLYHPAANENGAGFTRSTDSIEESTVGRIVGASFFTTETGYEVRYIAHVTEARLFPSLEEGLWKEDGYGVSIGGSGVPVEASDKGLTFGEDFTFDHLALVVNPAYERANVESIQRKQLDEELPIASKPSQTFIGHSISEQNQPKVIAMTEEDKTEINYEAEMESVQAALVLANSRIAEYEAVEAQRVEDVRTTLVSKATELGMSGHEDLSTPTLETLIASWEASHPEPTPVEMTPVESEVKPVADAAVASEDTPMVANYLNGRMVSNEETMYAKAYNAWASAWNQTLAGDEKGRMKAHRYDTLKEMN